MSLMLPRLVVGPGLQFDVSQLENIILTLADRYNIQVVTLPEINPGLTVGMAAVGGLLGFYFGGKFGSIAGAIGGAGTAVMISLRDQWEEIREKVKEVYYMVYNYLRSLGVADYVTVGITIYNSITNSENLARNIVELLAMQLGTRVISSLSQN